MYYLWSVFNTANEIKNRPLKMIQPQAHKKLNPSLLAREYKPPQTVEKVRGIITTFSQKLKSDTKKMIEIKKGAGKLCSVTLDKSTSTSRRYMNLNLHHDSDLINLGMIRIKGFMPAENIKNLRKERLHEFGLKMEDIVAATKDGASVMKSLEE